MAIYLLHGSLFFPSNAADLADNRYSAIPGYLSVGQCSRQSYGTHEDKGPFRSERSSFALFLKYLNSNILYNQLAIHVSSHMCHAYSSN